MINSAENAPVDAYMVVAPYRSDVLSETLRVAYTDTIDHADPFEDLMRTLDRIESIPHRI